MRRVSIRVLAGVGLLLGGCVGPEEPVTQPESITLKSPFHYPVALWDAEVEGETQLMVHVTAEGGVDSVYVLRSSGETSFDSSAVSGAYELRFAPGRRGDDRIAMWVRLPVRFRKSEPGHGESE